MHLHFPFAVSQVLWTLTFAAQLVLLVVLLGRDRIKRFPWFTASIALFAFRLLIEVLLTGRIAMPILAMLFITLADIAALIGLLVVLEMARRAFPHASIRTWVIATGILLLGGAAVLIFWGPWPARKEITFDSPVAIFKFMQLAAQKANLLIDVLSVQLCLLVAFAGRKFGGGWRSHAQRIVIGLSTVAASWLAVQVIWQVIATHARPHNEQEYESLLALGTKFVNANKAVYIAVLVWWIVCLWIDDPKAAPREDSTPSQVEADA